MANRRREAKSKWSEEDRLRVALGQLKKLAGHRHGDQLPADEHGACFILAMAGCGLPEDEALKIAPWAAPQIRDIFNDADLAHSGIFHP
jgi:hypothetical protein